MNEQSKPIDEYISLEDALSEIYRYRVESDDTRDTIRKEILETGGYDRGTLQFQHKDGTLLISKAALKDWINKRKKEKNDVRFEYMREKYPFFKSNLEFLMYREGKYTPSSLAEALQDKFNIEIGRSAVGNYLAFDTYNIPERDVIFAMAKQFGYTAESLGEIDIKSLYEQAALSQNYDVSEEDVNFFYPIICTENALENGDFLSGMCKYAQAKDLMSRSQEFYPYLQESMADFWNVGKEGIYCGYTNWITLFFIAHDVFGAVEDSEITKPLVSKEEFVEKNLPLLNNALLILKKHGTYTDLVHYFLARQLMSGLITTMPTGNEEQQMVGAWTMMMALASIKNPFAERFVNANKSVGTFLFE